MTAIRTASPSVVVLDVVSVDPDEQANVVAGHCHAAETVTNRLAGFISANIHRSIDGTRVMNYAQWTSPDHARAAHSDAAVFELEHVQTSVDEPGIASGASPLTIIVVMKCTSDEQDALVRYLVGIAQEHSVHSGFLLCGIHRSLDGTRVAEYIQWRDRAALAGMSEQPSSQAHFARVKHRSTSALCEVVKTIGPYRSEGT